MRKSTTTSLVMAGLFAALGLLLPYVTSHGFGVAGTILLPMHLPVLLCGLVCGPLYGLLCGIVVPLLSSLLTGMPAFYPMLPIMVVELAAFGLVGGWAYQSRRLPVYLSLFMALVAGWSLYAAMFQVLLVAAGGSLRALSVTAALVQGVPGLAAQLIVIPPLVKVLEKVGRGAMDGGRRGQPPLRLAARDTRQDTEQDKGNRQAKERREMSLRQSEILGQPAEVLEQAWGLIRQEGTSCVVITQGAIIHQADGRGVAPLLALYNQRPEVLQDACVVDRIIGKAAAMILVGGGAAAVYGDVMSTAAKVYLEGRGIPCAYGRCVDVITGRTGTGICPIERSVLEIDDVAEGIAALTKRLEELRQAM